MFVPFTNNLVLKYNERVMPMRVYQPKKKKRVGAGQKGV
jgi:hypothetical protein